MARGLRGSELPSKALEKNYASAGDLLGKCKEVLEKSISMCSLLFKGGPTTSINGFNSFNPKRIFAFIASKIMFVYLSN